MRRSILGGLTALAVAIASFGVTAPAYADPITTDDVIGIPAAVDYDASERIANWQKLQFGLFMHWGVYSMYEGIYKGQPQGTGYPEQIKAWKNIPTPEYLETAARMTAENWDAAKICEVAKNTGMKYVMITTKHHDGFAMWDTKTTDYNVVKKTAFAKDPMKQLADACGKQGIKLAFYFSIIDWTKHEAEPYSNLNPIPESMMPYIKAQLDELMTGYGPIAELWFDMGAPTADQSQRMADWVRAHQPNTTVVNSRVWNDKGDFEVGGDNNVPTEFRMGPWESILSIFPLCWSYCSTYKAPRTPDRLPSKIENSIRNLVTVIAGGGQFAFNIGPKGDGSIDPYDQKVLDGIGTWMKRHPDAITGARPTWIPAQNWGRITTKGNALFLFPNKWNPGSTLTIPGVSSRVTSVGVDGIDRPLPFTQDGTTITVTMQGDNPEANLIHGASPSPVIKVNFDSAPRLLPTQTAELKNGIGEAQAVPIRGAKGRGNVAYDAFILDRSGKVYKDVALDFKVAGADPATKYKLTVGETSVTVTGAELNSGALSHGFTLAPHTVTRIRLQYANPHYYADNLDVRVQSVAIEASENPGESKAPVFITEPADMTVEVGRTVMFSAAAKARPKATYQWFRKASADAEGVAIPDVTSATYSLNAQDSDNGAIFYVVATNEAGKAQSREATLTVTPKNPNIAQGKEATQVSTGWGGHPSRAVDGNTDGVWDNGSVSHTRDGSTNPWWQVDLGDDFSIKTVKVWNRSNLDRCGAVTCETRLRDFYVIVSPTNLEGLNDIAEIEKREGVRVIKVEGTGGFPSEVDFEGAEGRFVRVLLPGEEPLTLAEVEVVGESTAVAPTISPIEVSAENEDAFDAAGDGASRTVTVAPNTELFFVVQVGGNPEPEIQWQTKAADADEWTDLEGENQDIYSKIITAADEGLHIRAVAANKVDAVISGEIIIALREKQPEKKVEVTVSEAKPKQGSEVTFTATNLTPGKQATFTVASEPVTAGTATVKEAGTAELTWTVPADFAVGTHTVTVSDTEGKKGTATFEVQAKPLPPTPPAPPTPPLGPDTPTVTLTGDTVQGGRVSIEVVGFAPEEEVTLEVHSDPVLLGKVKADATGVVRFTWNVPADFPVGAHTLHVIGASKSAELAFTMAGKPSQLPKDSTPDKSMPGAKTPTPSERVVPKNDHLAKTGTDASGLLATMGILGCLGALALLNRKRS